MKGIKRNNMKKYINAILTLSSVLVLFYIIYDQHKQINAYKEKLKLYDNMDMVMDNIKTESFQFHLIADRYSIALELLREQDSVAAAKFERILEHETE
jgi:hypothetical protein